MVRRDSLLLVLPAAALILRVADDSLISLSYAVIAVYALAGRAQAIHALALSWLFTMFNPAVAGGTSAGTVERYLVLAAAAASVFFRNDLTRLRAGPTVRATLWIGVALVLHSLLVSPLKAVSILKALSWMVATATLLAAWTGLPAEGRVRVSRQLFGALTLLVCCSLPLVGLPAGYVINGSGFQGVLSHPQTFGPTMAFLGAWAGGRILGDARTSLWFVVLFGACCVLVVLSESRTAGVALLLGLATAILAGPALAGRPVAGFLQGLRSPRLYAMAGFALVAAVLAGSSVSENLSRYLAKRTGGGVSLAGAYQTSRGEMVERMWVNIQATPWRGIGFGIASNPETMVVARDPVLGLPVGAAVEKGVLPVALLEELGVFGFFAVMMWGWMLIRRAARGGGVPALAVLFTVLYVNLGEAMLFSPGGLGLLCLILVGWSVSARPLTTWRTTHA